MELQFLTEVEVAQALGISHRTVTYWRNKGTGPEWCRVGRKIKYRKADFDEWMRALKADVAA